MRKSLPAVIDYRLRAASACEAAIAQAYAVAAARHLLEAAEAEMYKLADEAERAVRDVEAVEGIERGIYPA